MDWYYWGIFLVIIVGPAIAIYKKHYSKKNKDK